MIRLSLVAFVTLIGALLVTASAQESPITAVRPEKANGWRLTKCNVYHVVASYQLCQPLVAHYAPSFYDGHLARIPLTDRTRVIVV
jgi:hypothetical protein